MQPKTAPVWRFGQVVFRDLSFIMLAQTGRGAQQLQLSIRKYDWGAYAGDAFGCDAHFSVQRLRVFQRFGDRVDGAGRHTGALQHGQDV